MRCVEAREPGPPEALAVAETQLPVPKRGDVLIRVAYAGVNRPDCVQRAGGYPPPPDASPLIGLEVSGTIVALGADVDAWHIGDVVCALTPGGGYAEYCTAPAAYCLPLPRGLSLLDAASLPENYFTVWHNVFERGRLQQDETLLVHGGSSGIGTAAIQLARARGARVLATAGSPEKCAACERLGAERAIDYRREDFLAVVRELTGGRGVDVVLDMVGGDYFARNIDALALDGRLVEIATLHGVKAELNIPTIMQRRLTITGSTLRARPVADKGAIARAVHQHVWPLIESGAVKPVIYATFPLRAAADAHRMMESSVHIGKLVLTIG
jgi:putative PIG3 family NAD(P)H quinone oxidoreductase